MTVTASSPRDGREISIGISGGQTIAFKPEITDNWNVSKASEAGKLTFDKQGEFELSIRPKDVNNWSGLDIFKVILKRLNNQRYRICPDSPFPFGTAKF